MLLLQLLLKKVGNSLIGLHSASVYIMESKRAKNFTDQDKNTLLDFFYLFTLQHLGHIASRVFGCVPEGSVFLLLCVNVSFVKFTDFNFMTYEFDE